MKKRLIALLGLVIFCSHDMYLKMDTYFTEPNQQASIYLYNGTFEKSENVIDRDRMLEASLTGNGKAYKMTEDQWSEKDSMTILSFQTGDAGTWVAGVSTKPRNIEMKADAFNDYLRHDGVLDMLEERKVNEVLQEDAVEEYSKHVKAIFQVGDKTTEDWGTELGYPIEFIPLGNPYEAHTGDELQVKLLLKGQPLADQLVYAGYKAPENGHSHEQGAHSHTAEEEEQGHSHDNEGADKKDHNHESGKEHGHSHEKEDAGNQGHGHSHDGEPEVHTHDQADAGNHSHSHTNAEEHQHENGHQHEENTEPAEDHQHTSGQQLKTDENGILNLKLTDDGIWYLRTIHMTTTEEAGLTHESNWATLTFEVTHGHEHDEDGDDHTHAEEDEFPSYYFWIGSLLVLGGLFFWFSRKKQA